MSFKTWQTLLTSPRFLVVTLLGFSSGLPLALTGSALEARYVTAGANLSTIGFVTLVGLPYVFKFLWAPLMDRYIPPFLGRRRGWILLCQLSLIMAIALMALLKVAATPVFLAFVAVIVAFLSASQDIAIDAYRTDLLLPHERGLGMTYFVGAYRIGMLLSGSFGLIMADSLGWQSTYLIMAACMSVGVVATCWASDVDNVAPPATLLSAFREPWREFFSRRKAILLLLLIITYKFGDAFAQKLMTTFFMRGLGFSMTEIGAITKLGGFFALLAGLFVGGLLLVRLRLVTALLGFGLLQAGSNLLFVLLAIVGKSTALLTCTIVLENFCGGMGSAAFLALIMSLCDQRYTATQFALLSALTAIPRDILGPVAAYLAQHFGWIFLYKVTFVTSFPGLILLLYLRREISQSPLSAAIPGLKRPAIAVV